MENDRCRHTPAPTVTYIYGHNPAFKEKQIPYGQYKKYSHTLAFTGKNGELVAEDLVHGRNASAGVGLIDDVIVEQTSRVNHLRDLSQPQLQRLVSLLILSPKLDPGQNKKQRRSFIHEEPWRAETG